MLSTATLFRSRRTPSRDGRCALPGLLLTHINHSYRGVRPRAAVMHLPAPCTAKATLPSPLTALRIAQVQRKGVWVRRHLPSQRLGAAVDDAHSGRRKASSSTTHGFPERLQANSTASTSASNAGISDGLDQEISTNSRNSQSSPEPTNRRRTSPLAYPSLVRKLLQQPNAAEAAEVLLADTEWIAAVTAGGWTVTAPAIIGSSLSSLGDDSGTFTYITISEQSCRQLLQAALEKGNAPLALSIYEEMEAVRGSGGAGSAAALAQGVRIGLERGLLWPAATIKTTVALVLGLCQQLRTAEAIAVIAAIQKQGLPRNDDVGFGKVVTVPLAPDRPLAVVQPQEGFKVAADAFTRYEYELFSGTIVSATSQALNVESGVLTAVLRAIGIVRAPAVAATHEFVVQAPDGMSRTFRAATPTSEVPGQVGERLTVVSTPVKNIERRSRGAFLPPNAPGTSPGQPLAATNHKTGAVVLLLKPPAAAAQGGVPGWVLPAALVLAGGDAATALIDPALPAIVAGGLLLAAGGAVAGNTLLLPRLRQLPRAAVEVEYIRQRLLSQHSSMSSKLQSVMLEAADDIRVLARLWQLQNKMAISGGGGGTSGGTAGGTAYQARIGRVGTARETVEQRLAGRLELLDGYSRVMNMIEIEVELDSEVPAAEAAGIEQQIDRLVELEVLQDDWRQQAEAGDEVEKLLRVPP